VSELLMHIAQSNYGLLSVTGPKMPPELQSNDVEKRIVVLTPLWAGSPPQSVMTWSHGVIQGKFFLPFGTPAAL